ncbi:sugar-binding protein [Paenibacillus sp. B01]|uniref:sugar-binding protein n=1 Tax=Paenibacillus sp. B01 TaxID=2660554 RepID=UPI0018913220|nr:sugar-binding protein [Paenibacillus sp. B01]
MSGRKKSAHRSMMLVMAFAMLLSSLMSGTGLQGIAKAAESGAGDRFTSILSPAYRSEITDDTIDIEFYNQLGTTAKIYSQKQPADLASDSNGTKELVGEVALTSGNGTISFPASQYPYGPITIRIQVFQNGAELDNAYLQLYNKAGVRWKLGLDEAPANPVTAGMDVVFSDDFKTMPAINKTGIGAKYASAKIDEARGGMFGWGAFEDFDGPYNPFAIQDNELMKLTTTYHPTGYVRNDYWGQKISTGYLSSMNQAGGGFYTEGGRNQYFEAKMFFGANPGMWPAFWTLTANGYVQNANLPNEPSDEIDIIEGYMGTPAGYQIAWHPWGYDKGPAAGYDASKLGGGAKVELDAPEFGNINLAMGFHTLATYITKEWTYYYCDNIQVAKHKTLPFSWEYGNYFIINAAVSDHYGISDGSSDPFANFEMPGGFTRYGNQAETYIDWVRVYQDAPGTVRFESEQEKKALPGDVVRVKVSRNAEAKALSGHYAVSAPDGWKIMDESGTFIPMAEPHEVAFASGSDSDELAFLVPQAYETTESITITPTDSAGTSYPPIVVKANATGTDGELIRVDSSTYPYRSLSGEQAGAWSSYDPAANEEQYFNVVGGGWWRDSWSWMYVRNEPQSDMQFKFNGISAAVELMQCSTCGEVDILVDGQFKQRVNLSSGEEKSVRAYEIDGLENGDHTLNVKGTDSSAVPGGSYIRIVGFEYRHLEDPNLAKFTADQTIFSAGPGDELTVNIQRNGAAGTRFGSYELEFPSEGWLVKQNGEFKPLTSQSFTTNRYADSIIVKVPAAYTKKSGVLTITPTASDGSYKPIKVLMRAPDAPEAPAITGDQIRSINSAAYPYVSLSGGSAGSWNEFKRSSQPTYPFTFNGNWWSDNWSWMYINAGIGDSLKFEFEGDAVALYARYFDGGKSFDIYLDGEKQASVDSAGTSGKKRVFSKSGLGAGYHMVELRATSSGSIAIEGFEYNYAPSTQPRTIDVNSSTYPYRSKDGGSSGSWANFNPATQNKAYFTANGGWWSDNWGWMYNHSQSGNDGQSVKFDFKGTAVSVFMRTYDEGGLLDAYLDGEFLQTIDSKSAVNDSNAKVLERTGLHGGNHVLELKVKGDDSRGDVVVTGFRYVDDPTAVVAGFSAPETLNVTQGEQASFAITRDEAAQQLSGTYSVAFPSQGWSVLSGGSFAAGQATDTIVVQVPESYTLQSGKIKITPKAGGNVYPQLSVGIVAPKQALPNLVTLLSPAYRAEIEGQTELEFTAPGGYATAKAYMLHQPDAAHPDPGGYIVELASVTLDPEGKGSFAFDADEFPHGPTAVKVKAFKSDGTEIEDYFQFYNNGGVEWNIGLDSAALPAELQGNGLQVTFADDFKTMPTISATGKTAGGVRTTYTSHKPDYQDYGGALFAKFESEYNPFSQVEDYLRIKTTYYEDKLPASVDGYQRNFTTGFLSSVGDDGVGFRTQPYTEQYLETRFFVGANPLQWPAFWTLTGVGDVHTDELDIIEAYLPTTSGYNIATHPWGYEYAQDTDGKSVNTVQLLGSDAGNIAMGFHTYAVHVAEEYTTYYFDNKQVYREKTLPLSWRKGNYFLVNNAITNNTDSYAPGYGFDRYGYESDMYIDWVRVYENPSNRPSVIFDTAAYSPVSFTPGSDLAVEINRVTDGAKALSGTYDIELPQGWSVVSGGSFAAGAAKDTIVLHVPESSIKKEERLQITPVAADGTRYKARSLLAKNSADSLGIEIYPALKADGTGYEVKVELSNKRSSGTLEAGTVQVTAPSGSAGSYPFDSIEAGAKQTVTIPAPSLNPDSRTSFTFRITNGDGYDQTLTKPLSSLTATRVNADAPIEVNGVIDPAQWAGAAGTQLQSVTFDGSPATESDRSGKQLVKWDDQYLYLALEVKDDVHSMNAANVGEAWGADSLQVSFDPERKTRVDQDTDHPRFIASYNAATGVSALGVESWGPVAGGNLNDIRYKFSRDEAAGKTYYVIAFPWDAVLTDSQKPAAANATNLGLSVLVNDNDGNGREGYLRYMDGIGSGKSPTKFGDLLLSSQSSLQTGGGTEQPEELVGKLTAPASARIGQPFEWTVGIDGVSEPFSVIDVTLAYDASKLAFETVAAEDGKLALAEGAAASLLDGLQLIGSAVKPEQGQLRLLLASTGAAIDQGGDLLRLRGSVKAGAGTGTAAVSLLALSTAGDDSATANVAGSAASIAIVDVDRSALGAAIASAQARHDSAVEGTAAGQYPVGAKAELQTAIDAAAAVYGNASATQAELNAAAAALADAVSLFTGKVIVGSADKTALAAAVNAAKAKASKAKEGTKVGQYAVGSKAVLQAAIDSASAVSGDPAATQAQVDQAKSAIESAHQTFLTRIITLVPGQTSVTVKDLALLVKAFGKKSTDAGWQDVAAADLFDSGEITIQALAAVARLILDDWLAE